jgi:hypothetical protein
VGVALLCDERGALPTKIARMGSGSSSQAPGPSASSSTKPARSALHVSGLDLVDDGDHVRGGLGDHPRCFALAADPGGRRLVETERAQELGPPRGQVVLVHPPGARRVRPLRPRRS